MNCPTCNKAMLTERPHDHRSSKKKDKYGPPPRRAEAASLDGTHDVRGHYPYHEYPHPDNHVHPAAPLGDDTPSLDEGLREALRAAIVALPQPTLGKSGGINRGDALDAIERVFLAALAQEGETPT